MVCFAQSNYEIPVSQCENWFRLLACYLVGVPVTVTFSLDESMQKVGVIGEELFDSLPRDKGDFTILTERFGDQLVCMRALPPFCSSNSAENLTQKDDEETEEKQQAKQVPLTDGVQNALTRVLSLCKRRKNLGGSEVFVSCEFSIEKEDLFVVFDALRQREQLAEEPFVTHGYYDSDECFFLVVNRRHPIVVTPKGASDGRLPVLDFDDGFVGNASDSMMEQFSEWKRRFEASDGDTWHEPILRNQK